MLSRWTAVITLALLLLPACERVTEPESAAPRTGARPAGAGPVFLAPGTPVAVPDHYVVSEGTPLEVSAPGLIGNDIDPEGDLIVAASFTQPDSGTLTSILTSGAFSYEPPPGFTGTDRFTYRCRDGDGNLSEFATVTIEVVPAFNRPPLAAPDAYATPEGVALAVSAPGLIGNDVDPDGDVVINSSFTAPSNGTLTSILTSGAFSYAPDPGFVGTDEFTYRCRDENDNLSESATASITVFPPGGEAPLAVPDAYVVSEGTPLAVSAPGLIGNDVDPNGDMVINSSFTGPSNGTLTSILTSGAFSYVPDSGFVGTDEFTYRCRDENDNLSESVTVTIEVVPACNRAPIGAPDEYATPDGVALAVSAPGLIGNDVDPDGDVVINSSFTGPSNGTLTSILTSGAFSYVPDPGFVGTDEFTYRCRDENDNLSESVPVRIHVLAPPDSIPPDIAVGEGVVLWPPNHMYETFAAADLVEAVRDEGDPDLSPADAWIMSASSDEPDDDTGDGATVDDIVIHDSCEAVDLRAERQGGGNGRVYVVTLAVEDAAGNVGTAEVRVTVPPDRSQDAVEDPPAYTVAGNCAGGPDPAQGSVHPLSAGSAGGVIPVPGAR